MKSKKGEFLFCPEILYKSATCGVYWVIVLNQESDNHRDWCERLYAQKAAELLLYGRALGLSHGEAEDVLQDVFLKFLEQEILVEQPVNYLVRTFRNCALNHKRSLWRRITRELESRRWFESEQSRDREEREALETLKSLPGNQREVVVLKVWHRMTFAEIAAVLDESPNTIAGRYRYALAKMKHGLRKKEEDESRPTRRSIAAIDPA